MMSSSERLLNSYYAYLLSSVDATVLLIFLLLFRIETKITGLENL